MSPQSSQLRKNDVLSVISENENEDYTGIIANLR
jgi:hypothetical protein